MLVDVVTGVVLGPSPASTVLGAIGAAVGRFMAKVLGSGTVVAVIGAVAVLMIVRLLSRGAAGRAPARPRTATTTKR